VILAIWTWRVEPRRWVRNVAFAALGAVILQGLLGGLTVLLLLPAPVSIGHAGLAQLFFCLTLSLVVFTSPRWRDTPAADDPVLRRMLVGMTATIYLQVLLGATMRHTGAGLAIPTFPLAFGHVIPPIWSPAIAIHFAHRIGAALVVLAILVATTRVWTMHGDRRELTRPTMLLAVLVSLQAALGAMVVLSGLQPVVNTLHVVNGALLLGTSLVMTLRGFRPVFGRAGAQAGNRGRVAPAGAPPLGARS
jgi:heme a synthase